MPTDSTKPTWLEPPPAKPSNSGCFGKGCAVLVAFLILTILVVSLGSYLLFSKGAKPVVLPVEDLPPAQLSSLQERVDQFEAAPPPVAVATPAPAVAPDESPTPPPVANDGRQLTMSASEINGLIAANPKSRGHASVSINGNKATVQLSISSDKVPGFPKGYLNGSFVITTDGPTPINALQVSKIQANGLPIPSAVLSINYRGHSILGYAMDAAAPYNVSTAEIRDGVVVLH